MRRTIKRRTYRNFLSVYKAILKKGYTSATAEQITRQIFDQYEACPQGLPVWGYVDMIRNA